MGPTAEKRFADCCSAAPLELLIEREEDGQTLARGRLDQPFALIGRDPHCDIHLNDPAVALRHAFAQVVNGHLFVIDLASPTGLRWGAGPQPHGWLPAGEPLTIGPFRLFLTRSASASPTVLVPDFHPLNGGDVPCGCPPVILEAQNGRSNQTSWTIDRILLLAGRADDCKLNLAGEDIALYHAAFVKTIAGLWVVDLLARGGTRVNDKKVRIELLNDGDELAFGKSLFKVRYPKDTARPGNQDSAVCFDIASIDDPANAANWHALQSSARIGAVPLDTDLAPENALPASVDSPAPAGNESLAILKQMAETQAVMFAQISESLTALLQSTRETQRDHSKKKNHNGEKQKVPGK